MAAIVSIKESKTILEGNSGIQIFSFDIILSETISSPVQIPYQIGIATDTATIDEDFTINIEPVTFNVGDPLTKAIIFDIKGDRIVEADEIFTITLGTPIGATLGSTTVATGTIFNDDSLPTITIAPTTNASETGTIGSFTITRTGLTELPLTVSINSNGGSATANNDHQPLPTQVTIAVGQTQATVDVTPIDDNLYEGSETIKANLIAASTYTLGTTSSAEITLIDDEIISTLPIISIIPIDNSNLPLEQLPDKQTITIKRDGDLNQSLIVKYLLTRLIGGKTQETTNTVTFLTGQSTTTIPLAIDSTIIYRELEKDTITLVPDPSYAIDSISPPVTINLANNQTTPTISINNAEIIEGDSGTTNLRFTIQLSNPSAQSTSVDFKTADGTAIGSKDYIASSGTLIFAPQEIAKIIDISIIGDTVIENNEDFTITLSNPTSGATLNKTTATGLIKNDDITSSQLTLLPSSIFKIENAVSNGTTLKFRKTAHQAFCRNEVSLFTVDDDNGSINGITAGQAGYQNAAIKRSQVIFAALSDSSIDLQLDSPIDRYINLETTDKIGLLMVVGSSIDEVNQGNAADILFSFPSANQGTTYTQIVNQGTIQKLAWEDTKGLGDKDFNDLGLEISIEQAPNVLGTEQQGSKDLLDLRSFTGQKTFDISISGDAFYRNTVGFYQVDDLDGKINGLQYGDSGYSTAALQKVVISGTKGDNLAVQLDGGSILAPFLIANNSITNVLAGATAPVYFGSVIGNSDKVDHIRLLGDNKFAFEDLFGGGDKDFNDVILQISARS
jgi:hypothetical protein